jgi:ADP-ribose pyrophosphatase YjhB (NUDIX family)
MNGHCFRCGQELPSAPPVACRACGYEHYLNARPTASLLVTDGNGRVLLLRRSRPPSFGLWETPGGFCEAWEEPAAAAVREGREELGVDVILGPFVGMFVGTYEFQDELLPVLDCFWWAALPEDAQIRLDPAESSESGWFDLDDPPALAFTTMTRAFEEAALNRWCHKADGTE